MVKDAIIRRLQEECMSVKKYFTQSHTYILTPEKQTVNETVRECNTIKENHLHELEHTAEKLKDSNVNTPRLTIREILDIEREQQDVYQDTLHNFVKR